jgi:hypothetical protein
MDSPRAYCLRCGHDVDTEHRYPRQLRKLLKGYFFMPLALVPAYPILASDYVLAIPMMMLYMLGIGPALVITKDPALCVECGALIPVLGPNAQATSH